ncbi:MAG: site-2 protease family protein [Deltaproteobacteria bacterium]|nr:site-2 protease family protein [Deltaproteobacteria bacterium]
MFGRGIKLFRLFGIQVELHWTFLLALVLWGVLGRFGFAANLLLGLTVFGSVLVHELGHSLVAMRRQVRIAGIELHFFGGVAKMVDLPRNPRDEIAIAAAGPLTSLGLAVLAGTSWWLTGLAPLAWVAQVNLTLAIFNLLPALPMDGGRIFRAALQTRLGGLRATRIASTVARGFAVAIAVLGLFTDPFLVLLAVLLWTMAGQERRLAEWRHLEATGLPQVKIVFRDAFGRTMVVEDIGQRW